MALIISSLILSLVIALFGIFTNDGKHEKDAYNKGKKKLFSVIKGNLTIKNIILAVLNGCFLYISILVIKDEAAENKKLNKTINESKELLNEAHTKIDLHENLILNSFATLKNQISEQGIESSKINNTLTQLTNNIKTYSAESKNLINSLSQSLVSRQQISIISIPKGQQTTTIIDSHNQIAIENEDGNYIRFTLNGRSRRLRPAQEQKFTDENGKEKHLVYLGLIDNHYQFTIKSK